MILPVFALYANAVGIGKPLLVGIAIGAYGLAQASLQIPFGLWSDKVGRKKVIVAGLILFIVGSLIAASSNNIYLIIFGRLIQGSGAIASSLMALLSDVVRENVRTKAMAIIGASIGGAFVLALFLGPIFYASIGMQGLFLSTAILASISLSFVLIYIPCDTPITQLGVKPRVSSLLKNPRLQTLNVGVFVLHAVLTSSFLLIPSLFLEKYSLAIQFHSLLYVGVFIGSFAIMWPLIKYLDKFSAKFSILLVALLFITQLCFFMFDLSLYIFILLFVLFFVGFNGMEASMPSYLSRIVGMEQKGAAMGVYSSSQFLGAFFGSFMGGLILELSKPENLFVFNLFAIAIWLLFLCVQYRNKTVTV